MSDFRFQDLNIWQSSIEMLDQLFTFAGRVNEQRFYRFAEQLRSAALSISNNIAEGSGSDSDKDFANFLNIARRSVFECANMIIILEKHLFITPDEKSETLGKLVKLSAQISNFKKSLR